MMSLVSLINDYGELSTSELWEKGVSYLSWRQISNAFD